MEGFFNLDSNWAIKASENKKRIYFENLQTGKIVFDQPKTRPLPRPWIICGRFTDGQLTGVSYFNEDTGASWQVMVAEGTHEVYFANLSTNETTFDDPVRGRLPADCRMRYAPKDGSMRYYSVKSNRSTSTDPRDKQLDLSIACAISANSSSSSGFKRQPIACLSLRSEYEVVKVLDPGSGAKGAIGGQNGGVFVVRSKQNKNLYVEKRFPAAMGKKVALQEIQMLRGLFHSALTAYSAAFLVENPWECSIYLEFCDMGSLNDLITAYGKRQRAGLPWPKAEPHVPEAFVWHTFIGLCDALCYLQTGESVVSKAIYTRKSWETIVHCDMKPDNVLVRSRSTHGSQRYPYVVISDFGLAKAYSPHDRAPGGGTPPWWAPEIAVSSLPTHPAAAYPASPHTPRSDVWALGTVVYGLCVANPLGHLDMVACPRGCNPMMWMYARASRRKALPTGECYSERLQQSIAFATRTDPGSRPDAKALVGKLQKAAREANSERNPLPDWAVKKRSF